LQQGRATGEKTGVGGQNYREKIRVGPKIGWKLENSDRNQALKARKRPAARLVICTQRIDK
jgi:hypothetical protein